MYSQFSEFFQLFLHYTTFQISTLTSRAGSDSKCARKDVSPLIITSQRKGRVSRTTRMAPSNKYEKGGLTSVVQTNEFYYPVDRKTDLAMVGDSRGLFTGGWLFLRTARYCSCLRREVQKNSIFEKTSIGRYCIMFRFESDRRPASWTVESHVSSRISQSFHPFVRRTVYHLGSESLVLSTNICRRTLEERAGAPLVASTLVVVVVLSSINVLVWKISRWQFGQTSCTEVCKTRLHRCNDLEKRFIVSNKRGR